LIQSLGEAERDRIVDAIHARLKQHFRPEFLNRVDDVLVFHRLDASHIRQIVRIQLRHLERLLAAQGMRITATDAALDLLAEAGFDPEFGARPLKRTLQRLVQDPLAEKILSGEVGDGDTVAVDASDGEIVLRVGIAEVEAEVVEA
jgi:ATP-dependent Clp protease ATP-binding subunit ClpB